MVKKMIDYHKNLEFTLTLPLFSQLWENTGFLDGWHHVGMWAGGFRGSTRQELEVRLLKLGGSILTSPSAMVVA